MSTTIFVYTINSGGKAGAWTRYELPFEVECYAQLGDDLYFKHGRFISKVNQAVDTDDVMTGNVITPTPFPGRVQWNWLDFGTPGVTKQLNGFDYVGLGQGPSISIGFDQRNQTLFTAPYMIDPDTLVGGIIPLPVMAPTMSVRLDYAGGASWQVQSVLLDFFEMGNGP